MGKSMKDGNEDMMSPWGNNQNNDGDGDDDMDEDIEDLIG